MWQGNEEWREQGLIKGIKAKDIKDFEKYSQKLSEVIKRIREYQGGAYIYATPYTLNLMAYFEDDSKSIRASNKPLVTSVVVENLDCGDW